MQAQRLFLHPIALDPRALDWMELPEMIAPLLPGHDERGRPRDGLTLGDIADEVVGWTTGPLDVVGTLLGGAVALHLALDHPRRVRSLLIACTDARLDRAVMERRAAEIEISGTPVDETLQRWFDADALSRDPEPAPVAYARERLEAMDPLALAQLWRALGRHDVLDRLSQIDAPTTWVAASDDVVHPPATVAAVCALIPKSRFVEIEGAHMAPLANPDALAGAIRDHLSWVAAQP